MLLTDFLKVVQEAGGDVEECANQKFEGMMGDTLQSITRKKTQAINGLPRAANPVNVFVASALWDWNGRHVRNTGIGASEETIVYLGADWAKTRAVNVYGPVPEEEVDHGVNYLKQAQVRNADPKAPIVVSRAPSALATLKERFGFKPERALLWLQDAGYPDLNADTAKDYDKIVVLTEWHKMVMNKNHKVPNEKMVIINNFLLEDQFRRIGATYIARRPHHFIYASSPDRGLVTLLKLWPHILKRWSDATLSIFYGWDGCVKLSHLNPEWSIIYKKLRADYDALKFQSGIAEMGRVNHQRLAWEMMQASVWAYPTHFAETGCLTAAKVMAAGCVPVCTPYAGLAETAASPWTQFIDKYEKEDEEPFEVYAERFFKGVEAAVEMSESERNKMSEFAIEKFKLSAIRKLWDAIV
jgi:glycosyltransferase involved in cell wall biosynthesis